MSACRNSALISAQGANEILSIVIMLFDTSGYEAKIFGSKMISSESLAYRSKAGRRRQISIFPAQVSLAMFVKRHYY
ncbi:hypothetical protein BG74_03450 [Sodalis-like endosymbiont of Proechinophthirus fluctus]|nr:hypothetical protein BG74_03450 [Sodalis-like endosymbiont of Proechinophthirus fluctus]